MSGSRLAIALWVALLALAVWVVARAPYSSDLSAFLPRSPSPMQQLLVQQLQQGPASRLILIGIDGGDASARAQLSRRLLESLRGATQFSAAANGEAAGSERDHEFVFAHRYALSAQVTPERFSVQGLHEAIADSIDLMASPAGLAAAALFGSDPTGETLQLADQLASAAQQPRRTEGVWSSNDGERALLISQTRASGADTDAQAEAVALIRAAFVQGTRELAAAEPRSQRPLRLQLTGPGVMSVEARAHIKGEAIRLSLLSTGLIVLLLASVYRSLPMLLFGLLPVVSGALAGVAAVALGFGVVYGITLGFGATLIGESVDYPIYFFIQSHGTRAGSRALWSTIALGALTSICGFASLLPSAFPGLAQLGLYSITGLTAAAAVTRWVLPGLLPARASVRDLSALGAALERLLAHVRLPPAAAALLALACGAVLYAAHARLWNRDLAALSPVPAAAQALDAQMRSALGAPDVSNLVIISAASEQAALEQAERAGLRLDALQAQHVIDGYDSPARYLPSAAMQRRRLASLPDSAALNDRLSGALEGLAVEHTALATFIQQVGAARSAGPIERAALAGTSFALAVDSLLWRQGGQWRALLPLHAPTGAHGAMDIDIGRVRAALSDLAPAGVLVFNLKHESDQLYEGYLGAALHQSLFGFGAIVLLLSLWLRSVPRVARVLWPLLLAVLAVSAGFALCGQRLTIMHLIGMLLIVAVGSNYALFFDRSAADGDLSCVPRTLASLLIANTSTVIAFSVLACSSVPVLSALGRTVAPGTLLVLLFASLLAPRTLFSPADH